MSQIGLQVGNTEREKEMKQEQEKLEKRIGLLNYLVDKDSMQSVVTHSLCIHLEPAIQNSRLRYCTFKYILTGYCTVVFLRANKSEKIETNTSKQNSAHRLNAVQAPT